MPQSHRVYIPDRNDLVWIDFDPVKGHEQKGRRPALVLSPRSYNAKTDLCIVCPITSVQKGYPFEVAIQTTALQGSILTDHIRTVDWKDRKAQKIGNISLAVAEEVQNTLKLLLF